MKKISILLLLLCGLNINSKAQDIQTDTVLAIDLINDIIESMPLDTAVDISLAYYEHEAQVLADINWLSYTPIADKRKSLREEKARFLLMWMSGCPYNKINVDDKVLGFIKTEPWTLLYYMMGWTKYAINTRPPLGTNPTLQQQLDNIYKYATQLDTTAATMAGITLAVEFYVRNKEFLERDKEIERFAKMIEEGTLFDYVKGSLSN